MLEFGNRLKSIRLSLGMTQAEFAEFLGFSGKGSICMIETGKRAVSIGKMQEIADKLNVDPAFLMGWDGDDEPAEPEPTKKDLRFVRYWNALNDQGKKRVLDYMRDLSDNEKYKD